MKHSGLKCTFIYTWYCTWARLGAAGLTPLHMGELGSLTPACVLSCKPSMGGTILDALSSFGTFPLMASKSVAWTPYTYMVTQSRKGTFQEDRPWCAGAYRALPCIALTNVILIRAAVISWEPQKNSCRLNLVIAKILVKILMLCLTEHTFYYRKTFNLFIDCRVHGF